MKLYYSDDYVTIYHGDCRKVLFTPTRKWSYDAVVTDPPYGINYRTGRIRAHNGSPRSIPGDKDTSLRDFVLSLTGQRKR